MGMTALMQNCKLSALTVLLLFCAFAPATADEGPGDCLGVGFDPQHPVAIGKIAADESRVYFLKSATDDAACPAATAACQDKAYLIPGNLALIGKTFGVYTCVSYESAQAKKACWTVGWLPSGSMSPAAPLASPARADWTGD